MIFLDFHQVFYLLSSISWPSLKLLAVVVFEISWLKIIIITPLKGHKSTTGVIQN